MTHRSGFVNIIGRPNVGKSTLMNALMDTQVSIITYKPQTTRHRIQGILTGEDFQIVFSDTPGYVHDPSYKMHEKMNRFVYGTFEDADIMLFLVDRDDRYDEGHPLIQRLQKLQVPLFLIVNKIDLLSSEEIEKTFSKYETLLKPTEKLAISALQRVGIDTLRTLIQKYLPEGPQYYPPDQLSDLPERFFVSEIIREAIFLQYREEVPYSCEVAVESFKEAPDIIRIEAFVFVSRKTQKVIIIGKRGEAIKKLGIAARKKLEEFLGKKVFLDLRLKVRENWRNNNQLLDRLGYRR